MRLALQASLSDWQQAFHGNLPGLLEEFDARLQQLLPQEAQRRAVIAARPSLEDLSLRRQESSATDSLRVLDYAPYGLKDLYPWKGSLTRAGSGFPERLLPSARQDAALVKRLSALGAVCVAKTHLHEFAYGVTGENPFWGACDNPRSPGRTTGGSSSGSAALVASGVVPLAFGTDTGGSVRIPAAFCGLYGFRGLPGDALIADAFPLASSCDTAGWLCRHGRDLLRVLSALHGSLQGTSRTRGVYLTFGCDSPDWERHFETAAGHIAKPADPGLRAALLEAFKDLPQTYSVLTSGEAAQVHAAWLDSEKASYSELVWQRIDRGRHWTDRDLIRASSNRQYLRDALAAYFLQHDFLVLPGAPCPAMTHGACPSYDRNRILALTAPASLAGLPVLSLPYPCPDGTWSALQVVLRQPRDPVIAWLVDTWTRLESSLVSTKS